MGYCIKYQPERKKYVNLMAMIRIFLLTGVFLAAFCSIVHYCWPEGDAVFQNWVLISGEAVAASALNSFADELKGGEAFKNAFAVFCRSLFS